MTPLYFIQNNVLLNTNLFFCKFPKLIQVIIPMVSKIDDLNIPLRFICGVVVATDCVLLRLLKLLARILKWKKVINKIKCYLFLCITQRDRLIAHLVLEKSKIYIASIFLTFTLFCLYIYIYTFLLKYINIGWNHLNCNTWHTSLNTFNAF